MSYKTGLRLITKHNIKTPQRGVNMNKIKYESP